MAVNLFDILRDGLLMVYRRQSDDGGSELWARRWDESDATLIRDDLVRVSGLPLVMRARAVPLCEPGTALRLAVDDIDLLDVSCRLIPVPT